MTKENNDKNLELKPKLTFSKIVKITILMTLISAVLFGFCLFWQYKITYLSIINSLYFVGLIYLFFSWYILMYNMSIIAPFAYGLKSFFMIFVGRRPKKTYFDYIQGIKNDPISKKYYLIPILASIPFLVAAIILTIIRFPYF